MSRYSVDQSILVVGFFIIGEKQGFQQYPSALTLFMDILLHGIKGADVQFLIKEVKVNSEHQVPMAWDSERTATGYTGEFAEPIGDFYLTNQYPKASYGQLSDSEDRTWRLSLHDSTAGEGVEVTLRYLRDNHLPWTYTQVTDALDSMESFVRDKDDKSDEVAVVLDRLKTALAGDYPNWKLWSEPLFADCELQGYKLEKQA